MLDSTLTFAANVKKHAGSCFHQLRQLRAVRHTLSVDAAKTLVHALITTRVDTATACCTASPLPLCVHFSQLSTRLDARLITGKHKFDHITDTMRDNLHWLSDRQRIQFKLCSVVSVCQRRTVPSYLANMTCIPVSATSGRTHLRSTVHCDLVVLRTRLPRHGPRGFAVSVQ